MKLLTRTNIYFIVLTLIVFSIGSGIFHSILRSLDKQDANERLGEEKDRVISYIQVHHTLPQNVVTLGDSISFEPVASAIKETKPGHVKVFNRAENEYEPYQKIEFPVSVDGMQYRGIILKPLLESDDLEAAIAESIIIIESLLFVFLLLSNNIMSKLVWRPFYSTLQKIKAFDLTRENEVVFDKTATQEFKALNEVLKAMTEKITSDYRNLKEFTENASHELQTPLSVIQSKLELLIQSENLTEKQAGELQAAYESAGRLAKLNQALLLLAKIENRQFAETKQVNFSELITEKLDAFDELLQHKNISVNKQVENISVQIHPVLADVLISNLIGNAIKHNVQDGQLSVELKDKHFIIRNSGNPPPVAPEQFFQRFRKAEPSSESLGLGLAIVKEICNAYSFKVQYTYNGDMHTVSVFF